MGDGRDTANSVYPASAAYMQQVAATNIIDLWSRINAPVLAIDVDSDFVTEAADHQRIVDVVNAHHAGSATFVPIPGMDHLLFASTPKAAMDAFSQSAPRAYYAGLSAAIVAWLRAHATQQAT